MNDGDSAPRSREPRPGVPAGVLWSPRRAPLTFRHRRRRLAALGLVAAAALFFGVAVGATAPRGHGLVAVGGGAGEAGPGRYFARIALLAGSGRSSVALAEQTAEQHAIDRTLRLTPYVRVAGSQHREMALTFDDGPGPYTPSILSILERMHAPATFFEVGIEDRYFSASTVQLVAHGFPVGDHTETHAPMSELSRSDQQRELLQQAAAIGDSGAPFPRLFRPPYGLWNRTTLQLLRKYRMLMVLWTVDTADYQLPGWGRIAQRALAGARPGAIILLHDAGGNRSETVEALPRIIRRLRARGYRLVTVPRLLLDNPPPRDQDVAGLVGAGG